METPAQGGRLAAFLMALGLMASGCGSGAASTELQGADPSTDSGASAPSMQIPSTEEVPLTEERSAILGRLLDPKNEIPEDAARNAYAFYQANANLIKNKKYMTIIDFTASSRTKRMHLIDMETGVIERYLVAHGKNSGADYATNFSNTVGSNKSSIGFYLTGEQYSGSHGISMRLDGLESTNSNARVRAIVVHGADYVSDEIARTQPRLGRSLGCPAVGMEAISSVVRRLKDKSLYYVYYVPQSWTERVTERDQVVKDLPLEGVQEEEGIQ